ncbi:MAG: polysaccharide deacetylase family protein [bacterium]|nr:polysaccharide deacetylase family protein [bacterium]
MSLKLRKIYRFLRSGSPHTRDYLAYKKFLTESSHHYKTSYFNLTIDLELAWTRARRGEGITTNEESLEKSHRARTVLPALLELSEKYQLPITFAVIAHVALSDCATHDKPAPFKPSWAKSDWYDLDPHSNLELNQDYYGADLLTEIKNSSINHEIATHGFSHDDLGDSETTRAVAKLEISQSEEILRKINEDLSTFIFPNNNVAYADLLKEFGFTTYRVKQNQEIKKDSLGLYQFPNGLWISPQAFSNQDLVDLIDKGVSRKQLINFWCHLFEFDSPREFKSFFEPIFSHIESCKRKGIIEALTIKDIISQSHE